ncbi:aspartyl/asparaginyl beta-hydroxylase domain-containing protein [Roseivirga thermotolerans]|uniref:Aspartyl/asparaginy/proline hydroxylase domain-containing protein n=1 Tax=Roseivirga thermotolerans TaxID=1758176 RepID=A0ABQ3I736_9BACT|nr:aspartyl/asparaginyl beta-hydroxylase domain-containing protein [Roseivirga thermotolerans]GHE60390.1 hypothetical protein GCM10011340_14040 [Roseivirga thermotolerans]
MKPSHRFSFRFDYKPILKEFQSLSVECQKHFNTGYYDGEWSGLSLRKPVDARHELSAGDQQSDSYQDTEYSGLMSSTQSILDYFHCEKTAVRILKLTPGSHIKEHSDHSLSFFDGLVRLHIPLQTNPQIEFIVAGEKLPMKEGECWFANFNELHSVYNGGQTDRIHLVIDLKVNDWLASLFEKEGIISTGEEAPDPMDSQPKSAKIEMIKSLLSMNSETSTDLAKKLISKYGLENEIA